MFGARAEEPNIGDRGSSTVRPPYVVTPLAGLRDRAGSGLEVVVAPGAIVTLTNVELGKVTEG